MRNLVLFAAALAIVCVVSAPVQARGGKHDSSLPITCQNGAKRASIADCPENRTRTKVPPKKHKY